MDSKLFIKKAEGSGRMKSADESNKFDVIKKCAEGRMKEPGQWLRKAFS